VAGADANEVAKGGVVGALGAFLDLFFLGLRFGFLPRWMSMVREIQSSV